MNLPRLFRSTFLFFGLFLPCLIQLHAQNAQLSGIVRDSSGAVIRDAKIRVEDVATHVASEVTTNAQGVYSLPSLPPGTYRIRARSSGFEQKAIQDLKVEVAAKVSLNISLQVGSESQTVSVDASGLQINTTDAAVSTVIDQKFVENIPLNGRSFQSLLTAVPGVTAVPATRGQGFGGELTVNGMRTEANYYTVDGVSMNTGASSATPGCRIRGIYSQPDWARYNAELDLH
jgi:hypothetical protein